MTVRIDLFARQLALVDSVCLASAPGASDNEVPTRKAFEDRCHKGRLRN